MSVDHFTQNFISLITNLLCTIWMLIYLCNNLSILSYRYAIMLIRKLKHNIQMRNNHNRT